jgi:catechol 2,3-dioxygenase-like lactoylglutathione lyase family enzyme
MYWLDHLGVVVSDLPAAVRFYTELFGTKELESTQWRGNDADYVAAMLGQPPGLELDASFVKLPHMNSYVELLQYSGLKQDRVRPAPTDIGAIHLGLYVDSAERALARIGRPTTGAVTDIPYGPCKGGKTAYLTDPDGVNIQFMQLDQRPGKLPVLKGADGWIDHIGVVVSDLGASLDFYSRLLETEPVQRATWRGRDADYVAAMLGRPAGIGLEAGFIQVPQTNTLIELIQYSGFEQPRSRVPATDIGAMHIALYVDSAAATLARMGVPLTGELTDVPYGPSKGGRTAYIKDPDGVNIQLMQVTHRPGNLPILKPSLAGVVG